VNIRALLSYPPMRVALAVCGAALVLAVWTFARALRVDDVPDLPPPTLASAGAIARASAAPPADIRFAVEHDPFAPERTAPDASYRMPGEPGPKDNAPAPEPENPVVVGTAVSADGQSFAVIERPSSNGRRENVRVGDKIGVFTVKSIERGHVVFMSSAGKRVDVNALKP